MTFTRFPIRLIHFSDCHLFANENKCLLGINTYESFQAILCAVKEREPQPDALLVTGDIAHESLPETYQKFWSMVDPFNCPAHALAGNHDHPTMFQKMNPFPQRLITYGNWQILLLETALEGKVYGFLTKETLMELETVLTNDLDKHLMICLHHHPIPVQSFWLDQNILVNHEALLTRLSTSLRVRAVLFGHVHQVFETNWGSIPVLSAPSTCFQFKPKSVGFTLDRKPPGYRWFNLYEDGSLKTGVIWLENYPVTLEEGVEGY